MGLTPKLKRKAASKVENNSKNEGMKSQIDTYSKDKTSDDNFSKQLAEESITHQIEKDRNFSKLTELLRDIYEYKFTSSNKNKTRIDDKTDLLEMAKIAYKEDNYVHALHILCKASSEYDVAKKCGNKEVIWKLLVLRSMVCFHLQDNKGAFEDADSAVDISLGTLPKTLGTTFREHLENAVVVRDGVSHSILKSGTC